MTTDLQHGADAAGPQGTADTGLHGAKWVQPDLDDRGQPPASPVRLARIAGLLYLVVAVFGGLAQIVRVNVYEAGDGAATAANMVANASLVRLSFVADLVQALVGLILAVALYRLLAHAGQSIARAMVVFVSVSAAIASLNMVHQLGAQLGWLWLFALGLLGYRSGMFPKWLYFLLIRGVRTPQTPVVPGLAAA